MYRSTDPEGQCREPAEVSWTSSSASGENEECEDGPKASSREADEAFLADSSNEFGADDVASTVTLRTLNKNCKDFLTPSGMQMKGIDLGQLFPTALRTSWGVLSSRGRSGFVTFLSLTSTICSSFRSPIASRGHTTFIRGDTRSSRKSPPQIKAGVLEASWCSAIMRSSLMGEYPGAVLGLSELLQP
ncbi:hypothetical protein TorRG33x02_295630 [Trema orientale]|uniref:Uncharacterized protein n=1 Tax=Trema orientale TaxID=63057 RepID=A0A2P5C6U9_TREOI|nr:hypothetical protein TorRG33x02_295630 [Trema orientale]